MQRKVVTILFCDVVGSTALGETTDPEALRALLARYFERMKEIVERHGGTVEKFIGDAVMAVFGIPRAHEDDALRACRAALEMQEELPGLGVEGRIGVTTGEVVTGTEERLATGDAVNVAARLQQAAQPGEVLTGGPTLEAAGEALEVEPLAPLELKGKAEPVPAFRLLAVHDPERRHEMCFVGRERELAAIRESWELALAERRCRVVTIVGEAGVGKSRLVAEALRSIDAHAVQGRCLSYGEGITYWPVVEMIKQLDVLPSEPAASGAIRSLLGESDAGTSAEEIAWAFRKLLEEQAPLVAVFDDIQWGEETFLDLLEHLGLLSTGSPLLLLCMARPELSERRPGWPVEMRLEPLPAEAVDELISEQVPDGLRRRIAAASGGNPLFVTEMLTMAGGADGDVTVPATLRALLAARLDQLAEDERTVMECAAVEGEVFHRGAVNALVTGETAVTPRLAALVRKHLIRPDHAQLPNDDGFRFRHLLIRDTAYEGLPKVTRAELHERFADWLEGLRGGFVELDELAGYHLEQAARYRHELGDPDDTLAGRAGDRLAAAGRRALWRSDYRGAASLFERALELTRPLRLDVRLELDLAAAWWEEAPARAAAIAEEAARRAKEAGDELGELLARIVTAVNRAVVSSDADVEELETLARGAVGRFDEVDDHAALVHVWHAVVEAAYFRCGFADMSQAAEQALRHARLAGHEPRHLFYLEDALTNGPMPADEALRVLDAALPANAPPRPLLNRARLLAMLGSWDEAWPLAREADARWCELSGKGSSHELAELAALAGDYEEALACLRVYCDWCEEHGHVGWLSTYAPMQGRFLCKLGRYDEAEPLARRGRELGDEQDVMTQVLWRQVLALVHSSRGEHGEAELLAREAVELSDQTDALEVQSNALCDLGEVLNAAGRVEEAAATVEQALSRYERKGNASGAKQARSRLEELRREAPSPEPA